MPKSRGNPGAAEDTSEDPDATLDRVFRALADRTRRAILARVADRSCSVSELAEPFEMSMPAVSKHLAVLQRAGLVERRAEGRVRRVGLSAQGLAGASEWLEHYRQYWDETLEELARYVESANGASS